VTTTMRFFLVVLFTSLAFAQDIEVGGCGCGCGEEDDEPRILTDEDALEDEALKIRLDPFDEVQEIDEPNKPPPVRVGAWPPPELDAAARKELDGLVAARNERPDGAATRYRLAEFYVKHRWWPHAEAEFSKAAALDPDSIRPWEGLLRVYAERPERRGLEELVVILAGGGVVNVEDLNRPSQPDWLPSDAERDKRITHAYEQLLRRRPGDVARRRAFLAHLTHVRDYARAAAQARAILARLPEDAATRFELAEALIKIAILEERRALGPEGPEAPAGPLEQKALGKVGEAFELLERNVRDAPGHAPSALRLARLLELRDGVEASSRIEALEKRAFFDLFVREEIAPVGYREDTYAMARNLSGPRIANRLWDEALMPPEYDRPRFGPVQHYRRWLKMRFPYSQPRERVGVCERLARRGDRDAAGILLSFLWHLEGPDFYPKTALDRRSALEKVEQAAIDAVVRLGGAAYPAVERFLRAAEEPRHRRRAVGVARGVRDARVVPALLDALARDVDKEASLGVAAALEEIGDDRAVGALVEAALDVRRPLQRRREAAEALAAFEDPRSVETLGALAKEEGFDLVAAYGLFRLTADAAAAERLKAGLAGDDHAEDVLRLLRKCEGPKLEDVLLMGLVKGIPAVRPGVVEMLEARFADETRDRVREVLLKEAESASVSDFALEKLGEMGGPEAAEALLRIAKTARGEQWAVAARALARTGDRRAVRYFNRARILERDPGRRRLAEKLHEEAAARHAAMERAAETAADESAGR